jgi:CMP-N,N'-diacetyllegionaminic acid synthase
MIEGRRVLVIVPARGGSKGVPLKNLREVGGEPLVARVGRLVAELSFVDRAIVSTDHEGIANCARAAGLDAPFFRPDTLSGDRISDWQVLEHALGAIEVIDDLIYDIVVMLQPTSPTRTPLQVEETVRTLVEGNHDSVWTVSLTDIRFHPLKQLTVGDNGALDYFDSRGADIIARQQLAPVYHRNGIAYAMTRSCLLEQRTIKGARSAALVIESPVVNIDTEDDLRQANDLLRS